MNLKIVSKKQNPLMKRVEVAFEIDHDKDGGTPSRVEIRNQLASLLKTKLELIYVKQVATKTGTMIAVGEANAYESVEQAKLVEPKHILARNAIPEEEPAKEEASEEATEEEEE